MSRQKNVTSGALQTMATSTQKKKISLISPEPGRNARTCHLKSVFTADQRRRPSGHQNLLPCLEHCDIKTIPYCITKALVNAAEGDEDNALLFCGSNAYRAEKIEKVDDVMKELVGEL